MKIRGMVLATAMVLASLALFASPAGAQYDQVLSCSFDRVFPGDTVTADSNGFLPGSIVVLSITDDGGSVGPGVPDPSGEVSTSAALINLGTTLADVNGQINFTFVVPGPTALAPGNYFVTATGVLNTGNAPRQLSCPFQVLAALDLGPLAITGSNSKPIAEIAIGLIAVGGLAVLVARRRLATDSPEVNV